MSEPTWIVEARRLIGLREITGSEHEPGVVNLFAQSGNAWVRDDETAWCGAFVSAMFVRAGHPEVRPPGEKANALRARQWLNVGTAVETPRVGDLVIFWRGSPNAATGHVGFYMGEEGDKILVLGGNQSNRVSIAKYAKSRLLGYRRPDIAAPARQPDDPGVVERAVEQAAKRDELSWVWFGSIGILIFLAGKFWGVTKKIFALIWRGLKAIAGVFSR